MVCLWEVWDIRDSTISCDCHVYVWCLGMCDRGIWLVLWWLVLYIQTRLMSVNKLERVNLCNGGMRLFSIVLYYLTRCLLYVNVMWCYLMLVIWDE